MLLCWQFEDSNRSSFWKKKKKLWNFVRNPKNAEFLIFRCSQIQTKRELFFKGGDSGGLTNTSPSVPSVPPPQPPTSGMTTTSAPPSTAPPGVPPVKPRLPPTTVNLNQTDASEDSNRRESARNENANNATTNNKETSVHIHPRPAPATKPKELDGYVGFANLPNQVYRKAVKKGFDFTLMVVGKFP